MSRAVAGLGQAAFENGRKLPGDGKLQGHAGLRRLDPEHERVHVDPLPAQGQHLLAARARTTFRKLADALWVAAVDII